MSTKLLIARANAGMLSSVAISARSKSILSSPRRPITPNSAACPRIAFVSCVLERTRRSRKDTSINDEKKEQRQPGMVEKTPSQGRSAVEEKKEQRSGQTGTMKGPAQAPGVTGKE